MNCRAHRNSNFLRRRLVSEIGFHWSPHNLEVGLTRAEALNRVLAFERSDQRHRILHQLVDTGVVRLCTLVGQAVAGATPEVNFTRRKKQLLHRALAGHFVFDQRADKPPSLSTEIRDGTREDDGLVELSFPSASS